MTITNLDSHPTFDLEDNLPTVSVIIPVYNAESFIAKCLERITNQHYPKGKSEVIVVDNGSTDSSATIIRSFAVKYLFCEIKGPSAARNRAIKVAQGDYLIFIDADCLAEPDFVYKHIKTHLSIAQKDQTIKVVGGGIGGYNSSFWAICDDFCSWYQYHPGLNSKIVTTYHPTANLSIAKKTIEEVGMFDEEHLVAEDVLFCKKVTNKGYKLFFEPSAKVLHINRTSCKAFFDHARHWAQCNQLLELNNAGTNSFSRHLLAIFTYIYRYFKTITKIIFSSLKSKRFTVVFFIPLIILNRTYFGYHKLKYGRSIHKT